MAFKKIRYNTGEEIFDLKIKDTTGATINKWVFMKHDFEKVVGIVKSKFGISKNNKGNDLDWAM